MDPSRRLILNEDCNHFAYCRSADEMTPEGVDGLVDVYAQGTQVGNLVFNVNAMRSSVAGKVKQAFWDGFDPDAGNDQPFFAAAPEHAETIRKWVGNMLLLHQRGIDPYQRWIRRSRFHAAKGWISVRMNDIHNVENPRHPMHDRLWTEHPEYWRTGWREYEWPADRQFDYEHEAVRAHHLAYIRECVERYDMDGLELDWLRQPWCFRPGHEQRGAELLTDFTAEVRRMLDRRAAQVKHPIRLAARIPSQPEVARRMGYDAVAWARRGLVDLVVPTPGFGNTDFDMPVELWKRLLEGTSAELAPGLEILVSPFPFAGFRYLSLENVRAAAATLLDRGADYIYLFNYMDRDPQGDSVTHFSEVLREAGALETIAGKARSHVLTYANVWTPGEAPAFPLPYRCWRYGYRPTPEFRIPIGPAPRPDQPAWVRLGFEVADAPRDPAKVIVAHGREFFVGQAAIGGEQARQIVVRVDGVECPFVEALPPRQESLGPTHGYRVPPGGLRRGDNVIEVSNFTQSPVSLVWVELAIGGA